MLIIDVPPRPTSVLDDPPNSPSQNRNTKRKSIPNPLIIQVVGGAKLPPYLQWITDLYTRMPKGAPAKAEAKGFWARYRQKYMHGDGGSSFAPVIHLYIGMVLFGYTYQVQTLVVGVDFSTTRI
jgi:hypothetical protein